MAAEMSKKPSIAVDKASLTKKTRTRLYTSVRDCLTRTQEESGVVASRKLANIYKGFPTALLS